MNLVRNMIWFIRWLVFWLLYPFVIHRTYGKPENVGYLGWCEISGFCLAFIHLDGSRQFRW